MGVFLFFSAIKLVMKVQASVKKMCDKCKIVSRSKKGKSKRPGAKKRLFVICENIKHKQRQG